MVIKKGPSPHPVRELMKKHGLNFSDLAATIGCSVTWARQIASGYSAPSPDLKDKLDKLFQTLMKKAD